MRRLCISLWTNQAAFLAWGQTQGLSPGLSTDLGKGKPKSRFLRRTPNFSDNALNVNNPLTSQPAEIALVRL